MAAKQMSKYRDKAKGFDSFNIISYRLKMLTGFVVILVVFVFLLNIIPNSNVNAASDSLSTSANSHGSTRYDGLVSGKFELSNQDRNGILIKSHRLKAYELSEVGTYKLSVQFYAYQPAALKTGKFTVICSLPVDVVIFGVDCNISDCKIRIEGNIIKLEYENAMNRLSEECILDIKCKAPVSENAMFVVLSTEAIQVIR